MTDAPRPAEPSQTADGTDETVLRFPDPELIRKYEELCPGFGERILKMAEAEEERRVRESAAIVEAMRSDMAARRRAQWFAFTIIIVAIIAGIYLIIQNQRTPGLAVIISAFTAILGAQLFGYVLRDRPSVKDQAETTEEHP